MHTEMNNQYKQLAIQAGMYVDLNSNPYPKAMSAEESEAAYKKFAELIVKECVIQCSEALVPHTGQPSMTHNYAVGLCQDKIKEHFGVEE